MADVLDVAFKIATDVNAQVAPSIGTTYTIPQAVDAAAIGPLVCPPIIVFPGTVTLREIMTRLEAGRAQIGIEFDETHHSTPQYMQSEQYEPAVIPSPAIGVSVAGLNVTITGTIQVGDVVGVQQGANGAGYAVVLTDTLTTVATGLKNACIAAGMTATSVGAVVTITSSGLIAVNVGTSYSRTSESWRRRKMFYATLWAPDMYSRQFIGKLVENTYMPGARLSMPDGTLATVLGCDSIGFESADYDEQQRDMTYIRKVRWHIDFVSTLSVPVTQVVAQAEGFTAQVAGPVGPLTAPSTSQL